MAFIQFNRAIQYFSGILLQMRRNDPANLLVGHNGDIGLDTRQISSQTRRYLSHTKNSHSSFYVLFFNLQRVI